MARMYGKMRVFPECRYGCCVYEQDKEKTKRLETEQWQKDAEDELDLEHENGICSNRVTGMGGCKYCYFDNDHGDGWAGDLDNIEGVTYGRTD